MSWKFWLVCGVVGVISAISAYWGNAADPVNDKEP